MKSTQTHHSSSARNGKHINQSERQQIERWLKEKKSVAQSAALLDCYRATIYREIKRGLALVLPKKTTFDDLTQKDVDCIAEWKNRYPRRIFNGRSARHMARSEKRRCITLTA